MSKEEREEKEQAKGEKRTFKQAFYTSRERVWEKRRKRVRLHYSFERSYREDYKRPLVAPSLVSHALTSFKILFRNWKLFGLLLITVVVANIVLVGVMSETNYQAMQESLDTTAEAQGEGELSRLFRAGVLMISSITTAGLETTLSESQIIFLIFFVAMIWLITTYFLRHILAGNKPRFRDGLFNSFSPIVSIFIMLAVVFIHLIPILIFVIVFSIAKATEFLSQPLYAFLFWVFGSLLILLSAYLLPVSLVSLSSVTVPGIYPMAAIHAATDLMQGRRTKYIIRVAFLFIVIAIIWIIVMLPITWLDLLLKEEVEFLTDIPFVPIALQAMTAFSLMYATTYLYLFYRRMLDDPR